MYFPITPEPRLVRTVSGERLAAEENKRAKQVLILIPILRDAVVDHVRSHSKEWFKEMSGFADIFYVIGKQLSQDSLEKLQFAQLPGNAAILPLDADDYEYPPLTKTVRGFIYVLKNELAYDFIMHLDSDTFVHPSRLLDLLRETDPNDPKLYMGRPIQHCKCHSDKPTGNNCTFDKAVQYCAGQGFVVSKKTLAAVDWENCLAAAQPELNDACKSSDSFVGRCMNWAGIYCTSAAPRGIPLSSYPPDGRSYCILTSEGTKIYPQTIFCQDSSHSGEVLDRANIGQTYNFRLADFHGCAPIHPLKKIEHFRYVQFAVTNRIQEYPNPVPKCKILIGVVSSRRAKARRDLIRSTYSMVARALGTVEVRFVLANPLSQRRRLLRCDSVGFLKKNFKLRETLSKFVVMNVST